jgi:hypothetical protein
MERESKVGVQPLTGAIRGPWGFHMSEKPPKVTRRKLRLLRIREERAEHRSLAPLFENCKVTLFGVASTPYELMRQLRRFA